MRNKGKESLFTIPISLEPFSFVYWEIGRICLKLDKDNHFINLFNGNIKNYPAEDWFSASMKYYMNGLFNGKTKMTVYPTEEEARKSLMVKYRGLREEDLPDGNAYYACITCNNKNCKYMGKPKCACPNHIDATEEEFAKRYDF